MTYVTGWKGEWIEGVGEGFTKGCRFEVPTLAKNAKLGHPR